MDRSRGARAARTRLPEVVDRRREKNMGKLLAEVLRSRTAQDLAVVALLALAAVLDDKEEDENIE